MIFVVRAKGQVRSTEIFGTEKQLPIGLCVLVFVWLMEVLDVKQMYRKYRKYKYAEKCVTLQDYNSCCAELPGAGERPG